jgi:hypothetical protein
MYAGNLLWVAGMHGGYTALCTVNRLKSKEGEERAALHVGHVLFWYVQTLKKNFHTGNVRGD